MYDKNEVQIRGMVVRKNEYPSHTTLQVATDGGDRIKALINVVFFNKEQVAAYDADYRVTIYGHMQLNRRREHRRRRGRERERNTPMPKYIQGVIGDSIEETKRVVRLELPEREITDEYNGGMPTDINKVILTGTVKTAYSPNEKTTCVTIRVAEEHSINTVQFYCFKRQNDVASGLSEGDKIACVCAIRTDNGRSVYMPFREVLYCKDLALIEEQDLK